MVEVGFIRHGVTRWNKLKRMQGLTDIPLSDDGRMQAQKLADRLSADKWDMVITSKLARAKETGEIIGAALHIPVDIDQRIHEVDLGEMEATTEADRINKWGHHWRQLDLGAETDDSVIKRGREFFNELAETCCGKRVLVVSHGGFIKRMMRHMFPEEINQESIKNTAISILKYNDAGWACNLFNCSKHLS